MSVIDDSPPSYRASITDSSKVTLAALPRDIWLGPCRKLSFEAAYAGLYSNIADRILGRVGFFFWSHVKKIFRENKWIEEANVRNTFPIRDQLLAYDLFSEIPSLYSEIWFHLFNLKPLDDGIDYTMKYQQFNIPEVIASLLDGLDYPICSHVTLTATKVADTFRESCVAGMKNRHDPKQKCSCKRQGHHQYCTICKSLHIKTAWEISTSQSKDKDGRALLMMQLVIRRSLGAVRDPRDEEWAMRVQDADCHKHLDDFWSRYYDSWVPVAENIKDFGRPRERPEKLVSKDRNYSKYTGSWRVVKDRTFEECLPWELLDDKDDVVNKG